MPGCSRTQSAMPDCGRPYRVRNESSLGMRWRRVMAGFRDLMELPPSSGFREQPWIPKLRASALINTAIGRMRASSHRTYDRRWNRNPHLGGSKPDDSALQGGCNRVSPVIGVKLGKDICDVAFHCFLGEEKFACYFFVRIAGCN